MDYADAINESGKGIVLLALEMSLTTTFGLLLFLMLGVAPAAIPYLLSYAVLLILFPAIALYLPGLL